MGLNKEDTETLEGYKWTLTIQSRSEPSLGQSIEMNSKGNLQNVFLEECLVELANDLRTGHEEFERYKRNGLIVQDENGNWNLSDKQAKGIAGKGVTVDSNEHKLKSIVEVLKDKKDFKGGEIKDDPVTSE